MVTSLSGRPLSPNIKTWSSDMVLNKKQFYGKGMEKLCNES